VKNMPAEITSGGLTVARRQPRALTNYVALTKPRLNLLVVATSAAGYYLGGTSLPAALPLLVAVGGTALVAAGAAVLNQVYERDTDALMRRTRTRPLPDGRVSPDDARSFGLALALGGVGMLAIGANLLAAALSVATLVVYLIVYTPLKRRSSLATLVGAVPGALPPLIGWAASHGSLSIGGWSLFAIVFLWQIPHFMAIAWLHRDDYRQAGFPILPVIEPDGRRTGRHSLMYAGALVPVSLVPALVGVSGTTYFGIASLLGLTMLWLAWRFCMARTETTARALFYGSIIYLPLLWVAMILNH
jgi:protoheme IX farnesyltransferase